MKLHWTSKGRVVYDRKIHKFNLKDVIRISKKVGGTIFRISPTKKVEGVDPIRKALEDAHYSVFTEQVGFIFGGGTFGGAGSSGSFGASSQGEVKLIVIIEEL